MAGKASKRKEKIRDLFIAKHILEAGLTDSCIYKWSRHFPKSMCYRVHSWKLPSLMYELEIFPFLLSAALTAISILIISSF